ncbi:MAG: DUF934 domain-containing protein [Gallionella sp.]|jgi:uncharacterized protein (DUF934 family)
MIIKNKAVVADDWTVLRPDYNDNPKQVVVPSGKIIVPFDVWQAQRESLLARTDLGVWFKSCDRPEELQEDIARFSVIAVDFSKFADGRGYTIAYMLRERLGYKGELRAIGDVLRDQLFYLQRVGFDAFAPRADKDINEAVKGLSDFSVTYQASNDEKLPLFRRVHRGVVNE